MPTSQKTTRKKARRDAEKNAITLLEDDHERVRRLLAELERTTEKNAITQPIQTAISASLMCSSSAG